MLEILLRNPFQFGNEKERPVQFLPYFRFLFAKKFEVMITIVEDVSDQFLFHHAKLPDKITPSKSLCNSRTSDSSALYAHRTRVTNPRHCGYKPATLRINPRVARPREIGRDAMHGVSNRSMHPARVKNPRHCVVPSAVWTSKRMSFCLQSRHPGPFSPKNFVKRARQGSF
jgi:hypothetical protein